MRFPYTVRVQGARRDGLMTAFKRLMLGPHGGRCATLVT